MIGVLKGKARADHARIGPALNLFDFDQPHLTARAGRFRVGLLRGGAGPAVGATEDTLRPEVDAVDVAVIEIQGALMRLEAGETAVRHRNIVEHRERPGDNHARRRPQRHQVGLDDVSVKVIGAERLAADQHLDLVFAALQLDGGGH